jgi:hypothetical protein
VIIGLGCGRCGTTSLAEVLKLPHEATTLPWEFHERRFRLAMSRIQQSGGDVGFGWLNYVEATLEWFPETRFVCLKRDRVGNIRSWISHMQGRDRFGWEGFETIGVKKDDRVSYAAMPTFGGCSIEEGVPRYYDLYYQSAQKLEEKYPARFRIFDVQSVLNTRKGQREMLRFVGLDQPVQLNVNKNPLWQRDDLEFKNLVLKMTQRLLDSGEGELSPEDSDRMREMVKTKYGDHESYDLNIRVETR